MILNEIQILKSNEIHSLSTIKTIKEYSSTQDFGTFPKHELVNLATSRCISISDAPSFFLVIPGESLENHIELSPTIETRTTNNYPKRPGFPKIFIGNTPEPLTAFTDFLNCTFPFIPTEKSIQDLENDLKDYLGKAFLKLIPRKVGFHGYKNSFRIAKTDGIFAYGGQRGTAIISLPSKACNLIHSWENCVHLFDSILKGKITRWDAAVDVFNGTPSVDDAVQFYKNGLFNCGGNMPSCGQAGNWITEDGSGRTFYVGNRNNGKMLRIYEKGNQLGDPDSPWVRWELELHNRHYDIPWDVLLKPGEYLAGSYPAMAWVNNTKTHIKTCNKKCAEISYEVLCQYARESYGKLINVMMEVEGSPEKVIERLIREGVPSRLDCGEESPSNLISGSDKLGQK